MKNILIAGQPAFLTDFEVTVLTKEIENIEFGFAGSVETAIRMLNEEDWDEMVVLAQYLESLDLATIHIPVTAFARNTEGLQAAADAGVRCYGVTNRAGDLLKNILNQSFIEIKAPESPQNRPEQPLPTEPVNDSATLPKASDKPVKKVIGTNSSSDKEAFLSAGTNPSHKENSSAERNTTETDPAGNSSAIGSNTPVDDTADVNRRQSSGGNFHNPGAGDVRSRLQEIRRQKEIENASSTPEKNISAPESYRDEPPEKAVLITVYSAKGGVGKTTIACNLATFLALTEAGRDHYRVAVIDFDIDFGDVMSTLGFDSGKVCMSTWANEIREKLNDGFDPDAIAYTETEVRSYMQRSPESGLYALLAPVTNEDSMNISEEEIRIMLRSVVENGGFDFVVCDTGNTTRDSAILPVEAADHVLLILTQSVNTANCNYSFIRILYELGFDTEKISLIINEIRPGRSVGVSVDELEEVLLDPGTSNPFKCIGRIADDNDVRASVNDMVPLVYKTNHAYTKSIGQIAAALIGEEHVLDGPQKKRGFFKFLRKR